MTLRRYLNYCLPKKDKISNSSRSNIVYEFNCPCCNSSYTGKTERNLANRLSKHSDPLKSSISKHLSECEYANFLLDLNHIFGNVNDINENDTDKPDMPLSFHNLIQINTKILHTLKYTISNHLLFLEALYIKYGKPLLNNGLKASKELAVFS